MTSTPVTSFAVIRQRQAPGQLLLCTLHTNRSGKVSENHRGKEQTETSYNNQLKKLIRWHPSTGYRYRYTITLTSARHRNSQHRDEKLMGKGWFMHSRKILSAIPRGVTAVVVVVWSAQLKRSLPAKSLKFPELHYSLCRLVSQTAYSNMSTMSTFEDSQKTSRNKLIITTSFPLILDKYTAELVAEYLQAAAVADRLSNTSYTRN